MRVSIHTGNHDNANGITDTVMFLKNAMQDCGHDACISHEIEPDRLNVVMEHFVQERHIAPLIEARKRGTRFVLIATEPIRDGTFNGGVDAAHWHYGDTAYWKLRFDLFRIAARLADAVWVLAPSMVEGYTRALPNVPVHFLPHGHVQNFATVTHRPPEQRDIDFYFSGSITDYRKEILTELARHHKVVGDDRASPEYLRLDHQSRAKVCLSLRLSAHNDIPSVSRMHFHLQNRNFMVHEAYPLPCPLDPFVLHVPRKDLVAFARQALQMANRGEIAQQCHDRFAQALPMSRLLPPLLDALTPVALRQAA